ncbi:TGS domain-containing protein, partial [Lacticaseibacillus paracasei]
MALDITFPDGNVKQFPDGTTVKAITEGISNSLAKKAVAGKLDGDLIAYDEPIAHSGQLQIMTKDDAEGLTVLRQTAAFVLAAALKDLYPDIHFGQGQATEDGFYYDTDRADGQVSVDDLPTVQKKMEAIIKENAALEPVVLSRAEAFQAFKNDPFKKQLVEAA